MRFLPIILAAFCVAGLTSCGNDDADKERRDGEDLRHVLRVWTRDVTRINAEEYELVEQARMALEDLIGTANPPPDPKRLEELLAKVANFEQGRQNVITAIQAIQLSSPLPVAVRENVVDVLRDRIKINEQWRIELDGLKTAIVSGDKILRDRQTRQLTELLQAYGPLTNSLKVTADDLEEQLRLPWNEEEDEGRSQPGPKKTASTAVKNWWQLWR